MSDKIEEVEEVYEEEMSDESPRGGVFAMRLLFDKKTGLPDADTVRNVTKGSLGNTDVFCANEESVGIACLDVTVGDGEERAPVMLMITACAENDNSSLGEAERSQMWDCPDHEKILEECKYSITAVDVLAGGLSAQERADLEMDYLSALLELFPDCRAVLFENSKKLITAQAIRDRSLPDGSMFTYFAVNIRFFKVQGTDDMLIDTLGMDTVFMPDLQYHFHGADPNHVVRHAYNLLCYILDNNCPIEQDDTVDGFDANGKLSAGIQWRCSYEQALVAPSREVIDIRMGELSSGDRE